MNLCRTCKFYVVLDEPQDENAGCCEHEFIQDIDNAGQVTPRSGVKAVSDGDEYGYLYVGPDFGCIHHKPRKKRTKQ